LDIGTTTTTLSNALMIRDSYSRLDRRDTRLEGGRDAHTTMPATRRPASSPGGRREVYLHTYLANKAQQSRMPRQESHRCIQRALRSLLLLPPPSSPRPPPPPPPFLLSPSCCSCSSPRANFTSCASPSDSSSSSSTSSNSLSYCTECRVPRRVFFLKK